MYTLCSGENPSCATEGKIHPVPHWGNAGFWLSSILPQYLPIITCLTDTITESVPSVAICTVGIAKILFWPGVENVAHAQHKILYEDVYLLHSNAKMSTSYIAI